MEKIEAKCDKCDCEFIMMNGATICPFCLVEIVPAKKPARKKGTGMPSKMVDRYIKKLED